MSTQDFAIKYINQDPEGSSIVYWQFNCWAAEFPNRLMTLEAAEREMARLNESAPYRAQYLSIVNVTRLRARAKVFGPAYTAVFEAAGWDTMDKATQEALRPALKEKARAAAKAAVIAAGFEE